MPLPRGTIIEKQEINNYIRLSTFYLLHHSDISFENEYDFICREVYK